MSHPDFKIICLLWWLTSDQLFPDCLEVKLFSSLCWTKTGSIAYILRVFIAHDPCQLEEMPILQFLMPCH